MEMSEEIHKEIVDLMSDLNCGMFDATLALADQYEVEIETIIERLDDITKELIKQDAISNRMIRMCECPNQPRKLCFG